MLHTKDKEKTSVFVFVLVIILMKEQADVRAIHTTPRQRI